MTVQARSVTRDADPDPDPDPLKITPDPDPRHSLLNSLLQHFDQPAE